MLIAALLLAGPLPLQAAPAPTAPAPATAASLDTPIETLMANPKTKAVIDADLPTLAAHPSYEMFKSMTLNQLAPMSGGALSEDLLKKVAGDLAAIR